MSDLAERAGFFALRYAIKFEREYDPTVIFNRLDCT